MAATPFQKQAQQRKILYLALIVVLFSGAFALRANVINPQAETLAIREQSRGDVEVVGSAVRLGLFGSRGLVTCMLWYYAFEAQKKNQWNELELTVQVLTRLQPHFIAPWLFQSWNLSYNVSVEADRPRDKYFYVARGIELLARGERQNLNHPDLRWSVGFFTQQKIGRSDETNYMRSLFQLSMIPPNERDPARFWKDGGDGPALNLDEFRRFCEEHPQLIRRLRESMYRDTKNEQKRQFTCEKPEDVVQFLEDNYQIPALYRTEPLAGPAAARAWLPGMTDTLLPELDRFPSLPPRVADRDQLSATSRLGDDVSSFLVASSWYSYSLEPLPEPGDLPGSSAPITDRARMRRPRHITTLIFRNYPAQGKRFHAEQVQEEGWYDEEPWDVSEAFSESGFPAGVKIGGGRKWAEEAWTAAYSAWREHGEANKLLFASQEQEQNMRSRAARVAMTPDGRPVVPPGPLDPKSDEWAAQYMWELNFYVRLSNFTHHYTRCLVEKNRETVAARKAFFVADRLNYAGNPARALEEYRAPRANPAWGGPKISALQAWRDLVLKKNKDFRRDNQNQETSAEIQARYQLLENSYDGRTVKEGLTKLARGVPLVPPLGPDVVRASILPGPFEVVDEEGVPYISDEAFDTTAMRMNLPTRRRPPQPPSGAMPTGPVPLPATPGQ